MAQQLSGPLSYQNWKAELMGQSGKWIYEYPLFTDGPNIVGELAEGFGPYQIINAVSIPLSTQAIRPALVLRVKQYLEFDYTKDG